VQLDLEDNEKYRLITGIVGLSIFAAMLIMSLEALVAVGGGLVGYFALKPMWPKVKERFKRNKDKRKEKKNHNRKDTLMNEDKELEKIEDLILKYKELKDKKNKRKAKKKNEEL
jgi:predicted tellurium resistance membrane protein TerC